MSTSKKFDPKKRKKLNNPTRLEWLPPQLMAEWIGISRGTVFADIGAGTGYLTRAVADLGGENCCIHALDIEPLMVTEMEETLPADGPIVPQLMEKNRLPFENNSLDGALMIALYHEIGPPEPLLQEVRRVLRPGGRLLIIDWEKKEEACEKGPPLEHRIATDAAAAQVGEAGFENVSIVPGFQHHFAIAAQAPTTRNPKP